MRRLSVKQMKKLDNLIQVDVAKFLDDKANFALLEAYRKDKTRNLLFAEAEMFVADVLSKYYDLSCTGLWHYGVFPYAVTELTLRQMYTLECRGRYCYIYALIILMRDWQDRKGYGNGI